MHAALNGHRNICLMLIEKGALMDFKRGTEDVEDETEVDDIGFIKLYISSIIHGEQRKLSSPESESD